MWGVDDINQNAGMAAESYLQEGMRCAFHLHVVILLLTFSGQFRGEFCSYKANAGCVSGAGLCMRRFFSKIYVIELFERLFN